MKIYFYKAIHPGLAGIYSHGVRIITKSIYSHCEIQFSDGMAWSSSYIDKGVRSKAIVFDPEHWDYIELPDAIFEANALKWFEDHKGQPYDILGNIHFIFSVVGDDKKKWFCSEAVGASLGLTNPWRFDPGTLYAALKLLSETLANTPQKDWSTIVKD